ncbi:MAG: methylmalonyl Co-A mutase-associated GTPase MeaB [Candidatus Melainabacteria bacterium HGW-Melainabacteria-1]|nr:MAG: methylmalonyl Co-A mutase-associated GTPase MeaB [Candidatus Melainabacteria bacterium HGW-Melainabacteria-1]
MSDSQPRNAARHILSADEYVQGVLSRDRAVLAKAVTLIESNAPAHQTKARQVLQSILPHAGQSLRIGITGYPGAGKSTLIEALGSLLVAHGKRVAVLAIDPSSSLSRGSILGDKTRMEQLARSEHSFIRPSPSGGALGGVARKTRETILLCEAAGYDVILVETVGVGQSEITVRSLVDFFLLVLIAGAGDDLQGIKRGVMEMADAILLNKADGENLPRTELARREFELSLKYLSPFTPGWKVPVLMSSALQQQGIEALWQTIERFAEQTQSEGIFESQRSQQRVEWFAALLQEQILAQWFKRPGVQADYQTLRQQVAAGSCLVMEALDRLFESRADPDSLDQI